MPSARIWIGSVFFAGMENAPLVFKCLRADSHHRFHSVSLKRSGTIHSLSSCAVALPSRLSKMFRTSATGSSVASFLVAARSLALRTRKCSAGITVRFSAAYCSCIGCPFLPVKSITIWLSRRFHSATRPNPQLLCRQNVPGLSISSFSAAFDGSLPASTSFSSSASMRVGQTTMKVQRGKQLNVSDCRPARSMKLYARWRRQAFGVGNRRRAGDARGDDLARHRVSKSFRVHSLPFRRVSADQRVADVFRQTKAAGFREKLDHAVLSPGVSDYARVS